MTLLIFGALCWSALHLLPATGIDLRSRLIERIGQNPYKLLFTVAIVLSILLMVIGWKHAVPRLIYQLPDGLRGSMFPLMLVAFVLFAAAQIRTNLKRWIRHPQLTGVILWSIAHLLANGDSRSVALFGIIGTWAVVEIALINRRDGPWQKPDRQSWWKDVATVIAGLIAFVVFALLHPYLSGVEILSIGINLD